MDYEMPFGFSVEGKQDFSPPTTFPSPCQSPTISSNYLHLTHQDKFFEDVALQGATFDTTIRYRPQLPTVRSGPTGRPPPLPPEDLPQATTSREPSRLQTSLEKRSVAQPKQGTVGNSDLQILEGEHTNDDLLSLPENNHNPTDPPNPHGSQTITTPAGCPHDDPDLEPPLTPEAFIAAIKSVLDPSNNTYSRTEEPLFCFDMTPEAAEKNATLLASYDYDIEAAIAAQSHSPVGYGSEFRQASTLEPLLSRHPLWPQLKDILNHGVEFPLMPISRMDRQLDLDFHQQRGNHKSAKVHSDIVRDNLTEDVNHGFALPLPMRCLSEIKDASLAPLGMQIQKTIDETGATVPKYRMTHDQTFRGPSGLSVNTRTNKETLPPCMYGRVLLRMTHYILYLRARFPEKRILIGKYDIKAAYRRAHFKANLVAECLTTFDGLLFAALRLTFGGAACPNYWSIHSEIIGDIANDLIQCPAWDPATLASPLQPLLPLPLRSESDEPFASAAEMSVEMPDNALGLVDVYLDDFPPVCVDINDNAERCAAAVPLAIHILGRPIAPNEPIPRDDLLSVKKTLGEGQMAETRIVLGWQFQTRSLRIQLTPEKLTCWSRAIDVHLASKSVKVEDIHTTLGRLQHVGLMLPASRHFLSRIHDLVSAGTTQRRKWTRLPAAVKADLRLFQDILQIVTHRGASMNNVVFRKPTHFYRSDASSHGLGGYNISTGAAWRLPLPSNILSYVTLNTLEFLGCLLTLWIDIHLGNTPPQSCILSQTDSTSAEGWLYKSNFHPERCPSQLLVARKLAHLTINADVCLYSQWFPGDLNVVSDLLSRRFDLTDDALTDLVLSSVPDQVPNGFKILALPTEIDSWTTSLLQTASANQELPHRRMTPKPGHGNDGAHTSAPSALAMTPTFNPLIEPAATESSVPLPRPSATQPSAPPDILSSQLESLKPPSHMWRRPFGLTTGLTQDSTATEKWRSFYNAN
jgi:hypothetical protein